MERLSVCTLGAAHLIWTLCDGDLIRQADGDIVRFRMNWMLWVAVALFGLSFLGRPLITPVLAKADICWHHRDAEQEGPGWPRALGEMRKHYHKALTAKLLGEIAKDLTGHSIGDVEAAIEAA
ncbi:host attachment protein (plasmid) [Devosia neptuniae]|uniref:Host attachment protein n=1 Tax=Devosia neptuniae TaxID=191302 RepID=A0ABY6C723_9HYPH|nr:host attachment protein [Devosia neptuniae]UXN68011.1 host attachment protein [Devosia neptuniae]